MALTMKVEGADALKSDIFHLKKRFERFNRQGVSIGYIEAKSLKRKDTPVTNLKIATWQTYGTHTIPPRPYLKPALLTNEKRIHEILEQALVDEGLSGKTGAVNKALNVVGMLVRDTAKQNIVDQRNFVPLAPATIAARKRQDFKGTKALIRTGALLNAIQYVVDKK
jgi:hypothetical protein|nr:MAG TPA: virion morphogenesis protein [Caudoviricetes sp.]